MKLEKINKVIKDLTNVATNHNAKYRDCTDDVYFPCFIIMKCNVPTLADVRMVCEKHNIPKEWIESSDNWGYISICFDKIE